jgi:hypothetical protein
VLDRWRADRRRMTLYCDSVLTEEGTLLAESAAQSVRRIPGKLQRPEGLTL